MGSYRMPSLIPLAVYTGIVPVAGVLIALFTVEQLVNGWRHGFEGPEDRENMPWRARSTVSAGARPDPDGACCSSAFGYMGVPVSFALMAGVLRRHRVHADQPAVDGRPAVPRHRRRDAAGGAVLPAGRRADGVVRRGAPHDPAVADAGRPPARRPGAGGDAVLDVLRRHLGLVDRRRGDPRAHGGARDGQGGLRPRVHRRADRLGLDDGQPDPAEHHGGGLRRHRQRLDRRAVPGRRRAGRADRHRPDDLQLLLRAGRA